jgi:hypothetical protein
MWIIEGLTSLALLFDSWNVRKIAKDIGDALRRFGNTEAAGRKPD